ncbi:MAG TPA: hypothetical protein VI759_03435 [Dehalococcoidia bacterium]|nr:hypothetical protein [Dehalococcoidia bacterium]
MAASKLLLRIILLAPPVLLALGGVYQLARSPFEFSGRVPFLRVLPMWVISVDAVIVSIPAIALGAWAARSVFLSTGYRFKLALTTVLLSGALMLFVAWTEFKLAGRSERVFHYAGFGVGTPVGSLAFTIMGSLIGFGFIGGFVYIYCRGVEGEHKTRFDRQEGETDALGEIIASMRSRDV